MTLKQICIMFKAQFIYKEGIKYTIPKEWRDEYES